MIVVPIEKDKIITKDGYRYTVVEYTNFKDAGPAVYAKTKAGEVVVVYFTDIETINGTKVEYQKVNHVFKALGHIKRLQHLPQPDNNIKVRLNEDDEDTKTEVASIRLKSKTHGVNKGLLVVDVDGNHYRLKHVVHVEIDSESNKFNRSKMLEVYKDYTGV